MRYHRKQFKTARGLLIFVGVILILNIILEWATLDMQVEKVAREHNVPAARVKELVMPVLYVLTGILAALAVHDNCPGHLHLPASDRGCNHSGSEGHIRWHLGKGHRDRWPC
jgi:hypothetical protein